MGFFSACWIVTLINVFQTVRLIILELSVRSPGYWYYNRFLKVRNPPLMVLPEVSICEKEDGERKQLSLDFWNAVYYKSLKLLWTKMAEEPVRKKPRRFLPAGDPKAGKFERKPGWRAPRWWAALKRPRFSGTLQSWVCWGCQESRGGQVSLEGLGDAAPAYRWGCTAPATTLCPALSEGATTQSFSNTPW